VGVRVEQERIVVEDGVPEICSLFGIDPYASISEGTLIIACRPHKADDIVRAISTKGIEASVAGEFRPVSEGMVLIKNGKPEPLKHPLVDPFWKAFYDALAKYQSLEA